MKTGMIYPLSVVLIVAIPFIAVIAIIYFLLYYTVYFPLVSIFWIITHVFIFLLLCCMGARKDFRFKSSPWDIVAPKSSSFSIKSLLQ